MAPDYTTSLGKPPHLTGSGRSQRLTQKLFTSCPALRLCVRSLLDKQNSTQVSFLPDEGLLKTETLQFTAIK